MLATGVAWERLRIRGRVDVWRVSTERRTVLTGLAALALSPGRSRAANHHQPDRSAGTGWGEPVQNLTFGSSRSDATIRDRVMLCQSVLFYDQFGQSNNGGGNYLADNMAPPECKDPGPCERYSAEYPFHVVTANSLHCFVRPKDRSATSIVPAEFGKRQPVGASGFRLRYSGPNGGLGSLGGLDMCWETRVRLSRPLPYYWWSLWIAGEKWNNGAELDVPESFGFDNGFNHTNYDGRLFHTNSVGGTDRIAASNWEPYVPSGLSPLTEWHTFTTIYRRDDTWETFVDGRASNGGTMPWRVGGQRDGQTLSSVSYLVDNTWGHHGVKSVRPTRVDAKIFEGFYYEYDYTRVWIKR
jgi:hypothetical protein